MAVPPSYGSGQPVRAMPIPQRMNTASPIAEGLSAVGQAAYGAGRQAMQADERVKALEFEKDTEEQQAAFSLAFAQERARLGAFVGDRRDSAAAGAAGHVATVRAEWDGAADRLIGGVTNPRVRMSALEQMANYGGQLMESEDRWANGKRIEKLGSDARSAFDTQGLIVRSDGDPHTFAAEIGRVDAFTGGLSLAEDDKAKLAKFGKAGIARSYVQGWADRDPVQARGLIDRPDIQALIGDPDQVEQLSNRVLVEQHRVDAVTAHQATLAAGAAREQIATIEAQQTAGIVVSDDALAGAVRTATALNDTSTAVRLTAIRIGNSVNHETQPWLPQQYQAEIARLTSLGGKRTADQDVRLRQLGTIAPERIRLIRDHPDQWAALNGQPAPALNMSDPGTIAQRQEWQRTVSRSTHLPTPFFDSEEAANYKAQAEQSPAGRLAVINTIAPLGGLSAVHTMRQVLPEDDMAARLVLLPAGNRAAAANGAEARKANRTIIDGDGANSPGGRAWAAFSARLGHSGALMGQGDLRAAFEIARNLYADWAVKSGAGNFDAGHFAPFIHAALGGSRDGAGAWHGGLGYTNGTPVLLPSAMSQAQFDRAIAHMGWRSDDPNAPRYSDGTVMPAAAVRKLMPVLRPDGSYEFHGQGTVATRAGGGVWVADIAGFQDRHPR